MSVQLIQQYHAQVDKIIRYGGTRKETAVRKPFHDLLEHYARQKNLELIDRFIDDNEQVIDLIGRKTAVSLQTMHIIHQMEPPDPKGF